VCDQSPANDTARAILQVINGSFKEIFGTGGAVGGCNSAIAVESHSNQEKLHRGSKCVGPDSTVRAHDCLNHDNERARRDSNS
jgi:hypothetical protein